jgi:hypothetical protein
LFFTIFILVFGSIGFVWFTGGSAGTRRRVGPQMNSSFAVFGFVRSGMTFCVFLNEPSLNGFHATREWDLGCYFHRSHAVDSCGASACRRRDGYAEGNIASETGGLRFKPQSFLVAGLSVEFCIPTSGESAVF